MDHLGTPVVHLDGKSEEVLIFTYLDQLFCPKWFIGYKTVKLNNILAQNGSLSFDHCCVLETSTFTNGGDFGLNCSTSSGQSPKAHHCLPSNLIEQRLHVFIQ